MTTRTLRTDGIDNVAVIAAMVAWFASKRVVRVPEGISERYVLRVGPLMLAGVEDTAEDTVVLRSSKRATGDREQMLLTHLMIRRCLRR